MKTQTESKELISICQYLKLQYPNIIFFCDLIGMKLPIQVAKRLAIMRSGHNPDLFIAEPNKLYKGLFVEMKASGVKLFNKFGNIKNEHIQKQLDVLYRLREKGYMAEFGLGFRATKDIIDNYLKNT